MQELEYTPLLEKDAHRVSLNTHGTVSKDSHRQAVGERRGDPLCSYIKHLHHLKGLSILLGPQTPVCL